VYREYDLGIFLGLHALTIRDHLQQWGEQFAYLASSTAEAPIPVPSTPPVQESPGKERNRTTQGRGKDKKKAETKDIDLIKAYFLMVQRVHAPYSQLAKKYI